MFEFALMFDNPGAKRLAKAEWDLTARFLEIAVYTIFTIFFYNQLTQLLAQPQTTCYTTRMETNSPLEVIVHQQQSLHRQAQRGTVMAAAKGKARDILATGTATAAQTLVNIAGSERSLDKDRIAASKDILDRVGVGRQREGSNAAAIPMQMMAMALAGIAAFAGRDMSQFGDMTDLQDKLETIKGIQPEEAEFEVMEENDE